MYNLKEKNYAAPDGISCKFYMPDRAGTDNMDVLVVSYTGAYPDGSRGDAYGSYIAVMAMYGIVAFNPDCIILDFSNLEYQWGNTLLKVFQDISQFRDADKEDDEPCYPVLAVTSNKSRNAFLSLVTPVGGEEPRWHFEDINKAVEYGVLAAKEWLDY